jgi:putative flippase GtrA
MISLVQRLLKMRIVRYAMVGGIGIFINDGALFAFEHLWGLALAAHSLVLFPLSSACAFEVSNIINFILNQFFTYREQVKGIRGWEWVRRAAKGQLTSLSAMLLSFLVAWALQGFLHVNDFLANPAGIVVAFIYNFFISNKLVFRATTPQSASNANHYPDTPLPVEEMETAPMSALPKIETSPK